MPNNPLGPRPGGNQSIIQIQYPGRVVKGSPGTAWSVSVTTAATTSPTVGVYDTATLASVSNANLICSLPASQAQGIVELGPWPCAVGITVVPGTGASVAIAYE